MKLSIPAAWENTIPENKDAPLIQLVSSLLKEANKGGASDIHLEPLSKSLRVRFRIDGKLQEMPSPPKNLQSSMINRLKIMTNTMNLAEKRFPQDGRIAFKIGTKTLDIRVSIIPSLYGESAVLRILDQSTLPLDLTHLGLQDEDQAKLDALIHLPNGMLLVVGPTGSGKTTTLYACLHALNKPDRKLITIEDPVEYQLTGMNQVQVNPDIGLTYATALRSILRQSPNVIMVGEMRDAETAAITIQASLTGHLVFSTLHTQDAPSAIARLMDLGIPPFLISSAVQAVVAQRLVRRLCSHCKQPGILSNYEQQALQLDTAQLKKAHIMQPKGCSHCYGRGYFGRLGIFELLPITDKICHAIHHHVSTTQLRQQARDLGMRTLHEDGICKILSGLTTAEEIMSSSFFSS